MEFNASHRHARMSAHKARIVIDMVRGRTVNDALEVLTTTHRRPGYLIKKVIESAVSNAEQAKALGADDLFIKTAFIDDGPLLQGRLRWRAGPQGRMKPIRKRTCHIHVILGVSEDKVKTGRRARRQAEKPAGAPNEVTSPT